MVLLVSSNDKAAACAAEIHKRTGERVETVREPRKALTQLRQREYTMVAIDESLAESEPSAVRSLYEHAGSAMPMMLNMVLSSPARVADEIAAGLRRHQREQLGAMRAAELTLRNELAESVAGILLSSELALKDAAVLPPAVRSKLEEVQRLAVGLRKRLGTGELQNR